MKTTVDQWELAGEIERLALKLAGAVEGADDRIVALTTRLEQWMKQAEDTEYHRLNAIRRAFDAESRLEQAEGAIERIRMAANGYKDKATQAVYTPASRLAEIRELLDEATAEPTKGEP